MSSPRRADGAGEAGLAKGISTSKGVEGPNGTTTEPVALQLDDASPDTSRREAPSDDQRSRLQGAPLIPRYSLQEEVGSGGMSVVYRAIDTKLGREVAVKVLHRHLAGRREERKRFRMEAQAVARLRHPSILEIHDYSGDEASETYIVSEFIRGPTLRRLADSVGLGLPEIGAMLALRIASALSHAHSLGVIHRDVKPENVMIQGDGTVKLTDFGIARMVDRDERMTHTGALLGSPAHMPPEVVAGEPVDHRADIFSLGTLLYWAACGELPYSGGSPAEILRRIVDSDHEDPRAIDPRVSDDLAEIILKAMSRRTEDRHSSAAELESELARYLDDAGFSQPEIELQRFLKDPVQYKRDQRSRIISLLMLRGTDAVARRKIARALSCFDRVLAYQPGHEGALEQVTRLRRHGAHRKLLLRSLGVGFGLFGLAGLLLTLSLVLWPPEETVQISSHEARVPGERLHEPKAAEEGASEVAQQVRTEDAREAGDDSAVTEPSSKQPGSAIRHAQVRSESSSQPAVTSRHTEAIARTPQGTGTALDSDERPVRILLDTWADIVIDGKRVERDREARRLLAPGRYLLSIKREGFVPVEETLQVAPGAEVLEVRHRLIPRPATIRIVNEQSAAVTLNDKLLGTATLDGFEVPVAFPELPDGRFDYPVNVIIRLEKPGYLEQVHRLRLRPGQLEEIVARLEPEV